MKKAAFSAVVFAALVVAMKWVETLKQHVVDIVSLLQAIRKWAIVSVYH